MANSVGGARAGGKAEGFERQQAMAAPATGADRNTANTTVDMTGTGEVGM